VSDPEDALEPEEPEWEDIQDALVNLSDLLVAADLLEELEPADAPSVVADLMGVLRTVLRDQRLAALMLRRKPDMAATVADWLDDLARTVERVLPPTPPEDE
jgi:hypothetical protein